MTPGARIAAVIEILELLDKSIFTTESPISGYFRSRRYIGSSDRKDITEKIFRIMRRRARLNWLSGYDTVRGRVITDLFFSNGKSEDLVKALFNEKKYNPLPLNDEENSLFAKLKIQSFSSENYPPEVEAELPKWIFNILIKQWKSNFGFEIAAFNRPAQICLRVNTMKDSLRNTQKRLLKDKIITEATNLSPIGLKLKVRENLSKSFALKNGLIEIQDEGSQLIAALVDSKPNHKTIDLCAGAGGKALALGAAMKNTGLIIACDTNSKRLNKIKPRIKRSGLKNISIYHIKNNNDAFFSEHAQTSNRVLIDVPCSGSGTWRRAPEKKWKITKTILSDLISTQKTLMQQAAQLILTGGRLIYSTCSVLPKENEEQVDWFLNQHANFRLIPIDDIWLKIFGDQCPKNVISSNNYLSLTPARHDTDGFFASILEKTFDDNTCSQRK